MLIGRIAEDKETDGRQRLEAYLQESILNNTPYDRVVFELISCEGSNSPDAKDYNGAADFLLANMDRDRTAATSRTCQVFLGKQLQCSQCHEHPFDKWKQTDFFHMASFTYGVRAGYAAGDNREAIRSMISDERKERIRRAREEREADAAFLASITPDGGQATTEEAKADGITDEDDIEEDEEDEEDEDDLEEEDEEDEDLASTTNEDESHDTELKKVQEKISPACFRK